MNSWFFQRMAASSSIILDVNQFKDIKKQLCVSHPIRMLSLAVFCCFYQFVFPYIHALLFDFHTITILLTSSPLTLISWFVQRRWGIVLAIILETCCHVASVKSHVAARLDMGWRQCQLTKPYHHTILELFQRIFEKKSSNLDFKTEHRQHNQHVDKKSTPCLVDEKPLLIIILLPARSKGRLLASWKLRFLYTS